MARRIPKFNSLEEAEALLRKGYFYDGPNYQHLMNENMYPFPTKSNEEFYSTDRILEESKKESSKYLDQIDPNSKPLGGQIVKNEIEAINNSPIQKKKWWQIWK